MKFIITALCHAVTFLQHLSENEHLITARFATSEACLFLSKFAISGIFEPF